MLKGKNILLGVTGSIAAYKIAFLTRLLVKEGASVRVLMSPSSRDFITPLTLSTLSKNPVYSEFYNAQTGEWANHVDLGMWADVFVIAPASANTLAKMAGGQCDNLLMAAYLSAKCPVFVAPAMDLDMYKHDATLANIEKIKSYGNLIIPAENGELASGLVGEGRMAEPEHIVAFLEQYFLNKQPLLGKQVLITAGPTYENIDPVRFIGNYSTGKMGFAIAETLANLGAKVKLVAGPVQLTISHPNITRINVTSADEMYKASIEAFSKCDVAILSAAVADYKPASVFDEKVKKKDAELQVKLVPTPDILASLGALKRDDQILIGFALETNNELENAKSKLQRKNLDFIILNSLKDSGAGFKHDTNKISIIDKHNNVKHFELKEKTAVAKDIIDTCILHNA